MRDALTISGPRLEDLRMLTRPAALYRLRGDVGENVHWCARHARRWLERRPSLKPVIESGNCSLCMGAAVDLVRKAFAEAEAEKPRVVIGVPDGAGNVDAEATVRQALSALHLLCGDGVRRYRMPVDPPSLIVVANGAQAVAELEDLQRAGGTDVPDQVAELGRGILKESGILDRIAGDPLGRRCDFCTDPDCPGGSAEACVSLDLHSRDAEDLAEREEV